MARLRLRFRPAAILLRRVQVCENSGIGDLDVAGIGGVASEEFSETAGRRLAENFRNVLRGNEWRNGRDAPGGTGRGMPPGRACHSTVSCISVAGRTSGMSPGTRKKAPRREAGFAPDLNR